MIIKIKLEQCSENIMQSMNDWLLQYIAKCTDLKIKFKMLHLFKLAHRLIFNCVTPYSGALDTKNKSWMSMLYYCQMPFLYITTLHSFLFSFLFSFHSSVPHHYFWLLLSLLSSLLLHFPTGDYNILLAYALGSRSFITHSGYILTLTIIILISNPRVHRIKCNSFGLMFTGSHTMFQSFC